MFVFFFQFSKTGDVCNFHLNVNNCATDGSAIFSLSLLGSHLQCVNLKSLGVSDRLVMPIYVTHFHKGILASTEMYQKSGQEKHIQAEYVVVISQLQLFKSTNYFS